MRQDRGSILRIVLRGWETLNDECLEIIMKESNVNSIWVFAEQRSGELHEVSLELLGKARELAEASERKVTAVLMGRDVAGLSEALIRHGADLVLLAQDERLEPYRILPYTSVLAGLIQAHDPDMVLVGATAMGMELAPRVAARVRTGLSAHCIDLRLDEKGRLLQVVPGWGGGVIATIACPNHRPQMATVMPGAMRARPPAERTGTLVEATFSPPSGDLGPEVLEIRKDKPEGLPLERAEVVVAGGWGIGGKENWGLIEDLAQVLGGAVGATRPPVDEGWAREGQMIGQSGKTVRPRLYIGVGISGVMHHVVGMDQAGHVISINTDKNSEIFQVSDVIVVEDFKRILPLLIAELRSRLEQ
jgi:electron transfer flavoprotein alpha subunit